VLLIPDGEETQEGRLLRQGSGSTSGEPVTSFALSGLCSAATQPLPSQRGQGERVSMASRNWWPVPSQSGQRTRIRVSDSDNANALAWKHARDKLTVMARPAGTRSR